MNTADQSTTDSAADALTTQLTQAEEAFNEAMISNDVSRIGTCIADDWVLVTPEAGVVPRERILQAIDRGVLSHDSMSKDVGRVKVYGDIALVTARGRNTGTFKGQPLSADEWITDVYRRVDGRWLCVLTHLTPVATTP